MELVYIHRQEIALAHINGHTLLRKPRLSAVLFSALNHDEIPESLGPIPFILMRCRLEIQVRRHSGERRPFDMVVPRTLGGPQLYGVLFWK